MRKVFAILAILFTAAVVLQFYFAAMGVFSAPEDNLFAIHGVNGRYVLYILPILLIVAAALARAGRRTIWLTVIALLLVVLQTVLFILTGVIFGIGPESDVVPIGATIMLSFHAVIGVAILGVAIMITRRAMSLGFPRANRVTEGTTTPVT